MHKPNSRYLPRLVQLSTLLNLIAGFETPTSGSVLVDDKPRGARSAYETPLNNLHLADLSH